MKTLIKSLALAFSLAVITSATSLAETNPIGRPKTGVSYKTGVYSTVAGKLNVALDKETGGAIDIRLKSTDGILLYTQHVGKNERSCRLRLNLNDLEDGVYQLEITNGIETTTQNVTISTNQPAEVNRLISVR